MSQRAFPDAELSTEVAAKDNEHLILKSHCRNTGVHHVGLHAKDPAASAAFYSDILGMKLVGESGPENPIGAAAFLSSRPDEESHDIVLFADATLVHTAFKVSSLAEFRLLHARVVNRKVPVKFVFNHGTSFAFYFDDPDGNMIEVYWPTRAELDSYRQPYVQPLDLTQTDDALLEQVARGPASMS
jgi:catechol-2,3-dioxygenase